MDKNIEELTQEQLLSLNKSLTSKLEASKVLIQDSRDKIEKVEADMEDAKSNKEKVEELEAQIAKLQEEIAALTDEKSESDASIERAAGIIEELSEIGNKDEIMAKVESHDSLVAAKDELTAKVESYTAIGTPEEIAEVFEEYKEAKLEASAVDLGVDLGISAGQARKAIDKFESVSDAKDFLAEFIPAKVEVVAEPEKAKVESAVIVGEEVEKEEVPVMKAESSFDELRAVMKKLG